MTNVIPNRTKKMKIAAIIPFSRLRRNMRVLNRLFCCPETYSLGLARELLAVTSFKMEGRMETRWQEEGSSGAYQLEVNIKAVTNLVKYSKH